MYIPPDSNEPRNMININTNMTRWQVVFWKGLKLLTDDFFDLRVDPLFELKVNAYQDCDSLSSMSDFDLLLTTSTLSMSGGKNRSTFVSSLVGNEAFFVLSLGALNLNFFSRKDHDFLGLSFTSRSTLEPISLSTVLSRYLWRLAELFLSPFGLLWPRVCFVYWYISSLDVWVWVYQLSF